MATRKTNGATALRAIAEAQRPAVEVGEDRPARPLLEGPGLIDALGPFVQRTLNLKDAQDALKHAREDLCERAEALFDAACEQAGELLTAADLAGGTWHDDETDRDLQLFDGEVQYQCQVTAKDLEVGGRKEKLLNAEARRLMPEAVRLELTVDLIDQAELDALVAELGAERIAKWFKVSFVRRALAGDAVRELYRRKGTRRVLANLEAAGAVELKRFPRVIARQ